MRADDAEESRHHESAWKYSVACSRANAGLSGAIEACPVVALRMS
jgi:hypothetical protein